MGFSVVMGVSVVIIFSVVMGFSVVVGCASRVRSRRFAPRQRAFGALSRLKHHPLKYNQFPSDPEALETVFWKIKIVMI